jgi:acylphosphatase
LLVGRHYRVEGRVQGVGFRYFVERAARQEGLSGHVRNLAEGAVEVEVEGEAEAVERFERQLRLGPPMSRVDHVEVTLQPPGGRVTGFRIRG